MTGQESWATKLKNATDAGVEYKIARYQEIMQREGVPEGAQGPESCEWHRAHNKLMRWRVEKARRETPPPWADLARVTAERERKVHPDPPVECKLSDVARALEAVGERFRIIERELLVHRESLPAEARARLKLICGIDTGIASG